MRYVSFVVAIATLAVVGCADQYYPGSGYSQQGYPGSGYSQQGYPGSGYSQQGYAYPSSYPANYGSYQGSGSYPARYGYGSTGGYSNYGGARSGPGLTITLP
jgi:hypothetical protein